MLDYGDCGAEWCLGGKTKLQRQISLISVANYHSNILWKWISRASEMLQRCSGLMKNVAYPWEWDKNEQIIAESHQILNMRPLLDEYYMKLFYIIWKCMPSLEPVTAFEVDTTPSLIKRLKKLTFFTKTAVCSQQFGEYYLYFESCFRLHYCLFVTLRL